MLWNTLFRFYTPIFFQRPRFVRKRAITDDSIFWSGLTRSKAIERLVNFRFDKLRINLGNSLFHHIGPFFDLVHHRNYRFLYVAEWCPEDFFFLLGLLVLVISVGDDEFQKALLEFEHLAVVTSGHYFADGVQLHFYLQIIEGPLLAHLGEIARV